MKTLISIFWMAGIAVMLTACGRGQEPEAQVEEATVRDLRGEEFTYEIDGQPFSGYVAYDANSSNVPGVLVVHEWWGYNDYVRMRADMLAEMGYTALALDMYGAGKLADHPESAQQFMMEVVSNMDAAIVRFDTALEILQDHPTVDSTKVAAIGYCFGGGVVLAMARRGIELDAVASFHGSLATPERVQPGTVKGRILVLHGADDPFVSQEELAGFEEEMAAAEVDMRLVAYPGVIHSFTNPAATAVGEAFDMPLRYDAAADSASWRELDTFLADTFQDAQPGV